MLLQVVKCMLAKAKEDKVLQFRYCARFLPCTHICRADKASIAATAKELVAAGFDCSVLSLHLSELILRTVPKTREPIPLGSYCYVRYLHGIDIDRHRPLVHCTAYQGYICLLDRIPSSTQSGQSNDFGVEPAAWAAVPCT
jgi:hypothetical protein